jgi:hypothetical protein
MAQNRYPRIWQTAPHGEHTITLVQDDADYRHRIYNLCQKLPAGKGTRIITMLGSEIESLCVWLHDTESQRTGGLIPTQMPGSKEDA